MKSGSAEQNSTYSLERIRLLLEPGKLGADGKLPTERALGDMLGVSRRSVRRALEVLESEGRIWRRQGAGTFVGSAPSAQSLTFENLAAESNFIEVMEVRLCIEPQLAQLAALRANSTDVERLHDLVVKIDASEDSDGRELWDSALHRGIAECAGNRLYIAVFELVDRVRQNPAWINIRERARSKAHLSTYSAQHRAIIDAIAARDPAAAGEAMRRHLLLLQENLIRQTAMGDHGEAIAGTVRPAGETMRAGDAT